MSATVSPSQSGLFVTADGSDDGGPQMGGPLTQQKANAPGRRVDQQGVTRLDDKGLPQKVLRGQSLDHHRRRLTIINIVRQGHEQRCGHHTSLGIGPDRTAGIGDTVAGGDLADAGTDGLDHSGSLNTQPTWKVQRIKTRPVIGIDVVEADRRMSYESLTWAGIADRDIDRRQNLWTTNCVNLNRCNHGLCSLLRSKSPLPLSTVLSPLSPGRMGPRSGILDEGTMEKNGPLANTKHLAEIVGQVGEGVAVASFDGKITYVNQAWADMHEYTREELIGVNLSLFHSDRQMVEDVEPFNIVVRQTGRFQGEVGHITRSGREFPTLMTTTVLKNDKGVPIEMVAVARDITESNRINQNLKTRGRYLSSLAEISSLMIETKDVLLFLPEVLRLLGETARVSRTYIFANEILGNGELACSRVAGWEREGIPSHPEDANLKYLPYEANGLSRWVEILGAGDIIAGNVTDFPEVRKSET